MCALFRNMSNKSLIGAIDQGTTSTRFLLFEKETFKVVHKQRSPINLVPIVKEPGWAEMCPVQIYTSVIKAMEEGVSSASAKNLKSIFNFDLFY